MKASATLVDIGANLTHESFADDLEQVLDRAQRAGVGTLIVTGSNVQESRNALVLAERFPQLLRSTAGVHPHEASQYTTDTIPQLRTVAASSHVVAIGECGLDFYRDISPRDVQQTCLEAQLTLASELKMPVFLHERDAGKEMLSILGRFRDRLPKAVVHCFTGDRSTLYGYLDLDLHIGITGWICDERRGKHLHELIPRIPPNRLMIETDAPYLLPRNITPKPKSRRNEPCYLPFVLNTVAHCLGVPSAQLAQQTTETAREFFHL